LRVRNTVAALLGLALAMASSPARATVTAATVSAAAPTTASASASATAFGLSHADGGAQRSARTLGTARASHAATLICAKVAAKAGFSFDHTVATAAGRQPQIVVAIAVALAESSCDPHATNITSSGSEDRGLWQMNSHYHSEVSDTCAFQIQCNANAAWNVSRHGTDWKPWSAFTNGAWKTHLADARSVISSGFTFQLGNTGTGTCLAADRNHHADGGPVWQWACNSADSYQQWTVVSALGALPILRSLGAGTCLAWDAQTLVQRTCAAADPDQQFSFLGSGRLNSNGAAQALMQGNHIATCVDADGNSHADSAPIKQWTCDKSDNFQKWN
jgi:hypothetical protein